MCSYYYCCGPEYRQILDSIDPVFVVGKRKLSAVIKFLSDQLAECFRINNELMPPWRRAESMHARWFPQKLHDMSVDEYREEIASKGLGTIDDTPTIP